jgi:hypothetical protein
MVFRGKRFTLPLDENAPGGNVSWPDAIFELKDAERNWVNAERWTPEFAPASEETLEFAEV